MRRALVLLFAVAVGACSPHFVTTSEGVPIVDPPPARVDRLALGYSNMYLLRGRAASSSAAAALVDAGSPGETEETVAALRAVGLRPGDLRVVVLTHGHGDHAGMASFFQKNGAKIVVGRGDEAQTTVGHNDEMPPTSLFARVLKPWVRLDYEPFVPDVLVDDELDLASYGLPGVRVRRMPGHTRGSLVVLDGPREAIVGDQMLGGVWGGALAPTTAGEHYYQLDVAQNRRNVQALIDDGVERFHLGHGGPVTRDAVLQWARGW